MKKTDNGGGQWSANTQHNVLNSHKIDGHHLFPSMLHLAFLEEEGIKGRLTQTY